MKTLLVLFFDAWDENYKSIKTASDAKDNETLQKAVHLLNGSSANIGLGRLCSLCREIEEGLANKSYIDYENCAQGY